MRAAPHTSCKLLLSLILALVACTENATQQTLTELDASLDIGPAQDASVHDVSPPSEDVIKPSDISATDVLEPLPDVQDPTDVPESDVVEDTDETIEDVSSDIQDDANDDGFSNSFTSSEGGWIKVGSWDGFSIGLREDGQAVLWGRGSIADMNPPRFQFLDITVGEDTACGVTTERGMRCWGVTGVSLQPENQVLQTAAGFRHACAIMGSGEIECWGSNFVDLGDGQVPEDSIDVGLARPPEGTFVSITAGRNHNCALTTDGRAVCWGYNAYGQTDPPDDVFAQIDVGLHSSCGLRAEDGRIVCWGGHTTPIPDEEFTSVHLNFSVVCGLLANGAAVCWNTHGHFLPPALLPLDDVRYGALSIGGTFGCGVRADSYIQCWGYGPPRSDPGSYPP